MLFDYVQINNWCTFSFVKGEKVKIINEQKTNFLK